jgi:hypothetical protein
MMKNQFRQYRINVLTQSISLGLLILLTVVTGPMGYLNYGWAQAIDLASIVTLPSGYVTANDGNRIQIDNKEYVITPEAIIIDDVGNERKIKEFEIGSRVRFHLKRERVDQLILLLSR